LPIINYYNHPIAYTVTGNGFPLVFLHGFGEDSKIWEDYLPFFSNHQLICIDLPGSGGSVPMGCSIARMAKIVRAILEKEKINQSIMIGHSMGGYVTLAYAGLYPETLKGYCLFHSHPYADSSAKKEGRNKAIQFIQKKGLTSFLEGLVPKLFGRTFKERGTAIPGQLIDRYKKTDPAGFIYQLAAMRDRPNTRKVLSQSNVPVCFIIGKEDAAVPEQYSLNQTYLPEIADIHILNQVGHMGMFEAKEKTQEIIKKFIHFSLGRQVTPNSK